MCEDGMIRPVFELGGEGLEVGGEELATVSGGVKGFVEVTNGELRG